MSNITPYQSGKRANPAPFVPNLPAFEKLSEGKGNFAPAPKLRPAPRPLTPRALQNNPPASAPNHAGGSFKDHNSPSQISLHDAILALYRDLPRCVDILERRAPQLDSSDKAQLNTYRDFLTTPYMLGVIMVVDQLKIQNFTLARPLLQNPVLRVAQITTAMIDALQAQGKAAISIESIYNVSEDAHDVQYRIMAQLSHMLREINTKPAADSDFRSLLPS